MIVLLPGNRFGRIGSLVVLRPEQPSGVIFAERGITHLKPGRIATVGLVERIGGVVKDRARIGAGRDTVNIMEIKVKQTAART